MNNASGPWFLPLDTPSLTLSNARGKGMNLSLLARAGYPVPPGFVVTTSAYDAFVRVNDLTDGIFETLRKAASDDPQALENASKQIRARFAAGHLPPGLCQELAEAWAALGQPPVAVRSSATAEDLPGMSFAGQHDTYLNIIDKRALCTSVLHCWSTLWTARAISYRALNGIPHQPLSLAVVVQEMVPTEISGVLFTADPLTGKRTESAIDARFGPAEASVPGRVEPDHFVVDNSDQILRRTLGRKALAIQVEPSGSTITTQIDAGGKQSLANEAIRELIQLGLRVAETMKEPQDIEWA